MHIDSRELQRRVSETILPRVQTPAQYTGGELGAVVKPVAPGRGRMCLAFPDLYSIGMSHHGLQVLYALLNRREDWACERAFAPMRDMEEQLRAAGLPLFSLETCTPLADFDVLGFTLQYELCCTNVLTMLDLGGIPLDACQRTAEHPLVIAGGPCGVNPEPMARFIDLFVLGDGEESLPAVCDLWRELKQAGLSRLDALTEMGRRLPFAYVPQLYDPLLDAAGRQVGVRPRLPGVPQRIAPAVVRDLDAVPLPTMPIVPYIECVQDRIAIEIMRGCPNRCRFCQSRAIKRPVRMRKVETIVQAALETYRNTGMNDISLLSLSTSDYPHFDELLTRIQAEFRPLNVSVSMPSLRVNEQLRTVGDFLNTDRSSGLTLAPEAARDAMRERIGKRIRNEDLYAGCRSALASGFERVKLYFMCGLPGETEDDLAGILDMAETISRLGKEVRGRFATVVASVSNFVPKPHTPFQRHGMQTREYFHRAHDFLRQRVRFRNVQVKWHDVDASLLEGVVSRGDRRIGEVIERVWRSGARLDSWSEHLNPAAWWHALEELQVDWKSQLHHEYPEEVGLPWEPIGGMART